MKNLFKSALLFCCLLICSYSSFSQEESIEMFPSDTIVSPTKCLSEHRFFISANMLQFATGTINLNIETKITKYFSVKLGGGTITGTRILFNEAQQPCIAGGFYGTVEPRLYLKKATENCMLQYGVSVAYRYWNYTAENHYMSINDFNTDFNNNHKELTGEALSAARKAALDSYRDNEDYNVTDDDIYLKDEQIEHLGDLSFFGKASVVGGLTAEMAVGVGLGTKADDFYFTPNIELSFGWTFGKIKKE